MTPVVSGLLCWWKEWRRTGRTDVIGVLVGSDFGIERLDCGGHGDEYGRSCDELIRWLEREERLSSQLPARTQVRRYRRIDNSFALSDHRSSGWC